MNLLSDDIVITQPVTSAEGVAAATDLAGTQVDMTGFDGVLFVCVMGVITATAVTSIKAQQGAVTGMGDAADLEDSELAIADDDDGQIFAIDLWRPLEQFVRPYIDRLTQNAVVAVCLAIQYKAKDRATAMAIVDALTLVQLNGPAEGTA